MGKDAGCAQKTPTHKHIHTFTSSFTITSSQMEDTKAIDHSLTRRPGSGDGISRILFPFSVCHILSSRVIKYGAGTKNVACVSNVRLHTPHPMM